MSRLKPSLNGTARAAHVVMTFRAWRCLEQSTKKDDTRGRVISLKFWEGQSWKRFQADSYCLSDDTAR